MRMKLILASMTLMVVPALMAQQNGPLAAHEHGNPELRGPEHGIHGGGFLLHGPWWRNPDLAAKVGLSAEQTKKIDQIFTDSKLQLIQMHAALEEEQVRLDAALNATPFDRSRAEVSIDKSADLRAELEKADAKMLLNIRTVLTPEQWTKLHELRGREHADTEHGPRGRGQGGRGPGPGSGAGPGGPPAE